MGRSLYWIYALAVAGAYVSLLFVEPGLFAGLDGAALLVLGAVYTLLGTLGDMYRERSRSHLATPVYFVVQLALAAIIVFGARATGTSFLVPLPLAAQGAIVLPRWGMVAVSAAVTAIFGVAVGVYEGWWTVAPASITYLSAVAFVVAFSRVMVREAQARAAVEQLAFRLQEANRRLEEYAERAGETAVAAERSRLSRDLHDAVTQTLFSASLIAEVLPRLWERDQDEGRRRLEELRQLARGALAEMRMLLLELRPATLTEVPLGDLLRHLAEATTARAACRSP